IFFPQMRPEQKPQSASDEEFLEIGIPQDWIPLIRKSGYMTIEDLKQANPNKLVNDLNGMRKKMKLNINSLQADDVKSWLSIC
ncbi:MAG: lysine--tRNA ligase, partial [Bacteroidales bacterium]|nr:lysine--tRNA ligase [Bacteroidales bacterium]